MDNLDSLKKDLETTKSLQGIVSTMKSIAAVNIKKYEKVALNLVKYRSNIDLSMQAILGQNPEIIDYINYIENTTENDINNRRDLVIIIGSNQGLCGRFNDRVVSFYMDNHENDLNGYIITIGDRINMMLNGQHIKINKHFSVPNSMDNVVNLVYDLFTIAEDFLKKNILRKILVYYTSYGSSVSGNMVKSRIAPLERKYFEKLKKTNWPTNNIPFWRIDTKTIISDLVQQYIFASLYHTIVNSMTAEQKNRLITLQGTEENIKNHIVENNLKYNQLRQNIITSELIDVVSGARFLKKKK